MVPHSWLAVYWQAWEDLQNDRDYLTDGLGAGLGAVRVVSKPAPIRWETINNWGRAHGFFGDDLEKLITIVRALDAVFCAFSHKKLADDLKKFFKGK